jgi:hypothetical protein
MSEQSIDMIDEDYIEISIYDNAKTQREQKSGGLNASTRKTLAEKYQFIT